MVKVNNKGFSIVELVVVMAIFIVLMLIISSAFESILGKAGQQVKSAATNTEGIVGLEMLRGDLEHAGFGLPTSFSVAPSALTIPEATANTVDGITSSSYNFTYSTTDTGPRAIMVGATPAPNMILGNSSNTNPLTAYLVIKSTNVALNDTAKKWSYVNYQDTGGANTSFINPWGTTSDNFVAGERVITISSTFSTTGEPDKRLVMDPAAPQKLFYALSGAPPVQPLNINFKPADASQLYVVYGVDPSADLRMPYNRADYYLRKATSPDSMPTSCNPGTGILYKGVVKQGTTAPGGTFAEYPLLNCVGDMQVEFELDVNNDGNIAYSPVLTGLTAAQIRQQLKNVRVYILAHEGKKDRNYSYSNSPVQVGDPARTNSGRTRSVTEMTTLFGTDWRNYRWKVYTIVVHPKNLE